MYKYILFDLDDTLIDFSKSELEGLKQIHSQFYHTIAFSDFETVFKSINHQMWQRVGAQVDALTPNDIRFTRFERMNNQFNMDLNPAIVAHEYEKVLGESAEWLPGVELVIKTLHEKGHILGIITNGLTSVQNRKYERLGLANWFSSFVISDKVGFAKPNREIFELAFHEIAHKTNQSIDSIHKETVLMVGDSILNDGYGAMNVGIDFCLINEKTTEPVPEDLPIKLSIKSVANLSAYIEISPSLLAA